MKQLLMVSVIVLGSLASVSGASALNFSEYPDWAQQAVNSGEMNN